MSETYHPTHKEMIPQVDVDAHLDVDVAADVDSNVDRFEPDTSFDIDEAILRGNTPYQGYWQQEGKEELVNRNSIADEMNRELAARFGLRRLEMLIDRDAARDVDGLDFPEEPVGPVPHTPQERQPLSNLAYDQERDIDDPDEPIEQEPVASQTDLVEGTQGIDDFVQASTGQPEVLEPGFDDSLYDTPDDTEGYVEPFIELRDPYDTDTEAYYARADEETRRQLDELKDEQRRHDIDVAAAAAAIVAAEELGLFPVD